MSYKATFILGVPDHKMVKVGGVDKKGGLIYRIEGNAEFHNYLKIPQENKQNLLIVWSEKPITQIGATNIIINCITDPDSTGKSLRKAAQMTNAIKKQYPHIPIFNDPARVRDTSREKIYQKYNGLPGVYIPKVVRIKPKSATNVLQLAHENNFKFPFLVRSCGSHESRNFYLINKDNIELLEKFAYDGSELYLTEFVDYKSNDGLYHKARLVIIGGKICPRHYMTGESWMVHGDLHETYMANNETAKKDEFLFINNFRKIVSKQALDSFMEIYKQSGLDYLGFDFAIKQDGSVLIFEINPAQNPFIKLNHDDFPYMKDTRNNIIQSLNDAVILKIKHHKLATAVVQ